MVFKNGSLFDLWGPVDPKISLGLHVRKTVFPLHISPRGIIEAQIVDQVGAPKIGALNFRVQHYRYSNER